MAVRLLARLVTAARDLLGEQVAGWYGQGRAEARTAWERRPRAARAGAIATCLLLGATGLAGLARQHAVEDALPSPLDWRAAAALLARDARPGDAVVLSPPWLERAREHVPAGLPILPAPAPGEPLPGVRRAWLLAAPGAPRLDPSPHQALAGLAARADVQRLGAFQISRFDLAEPVLPLADLAGLLPALAGLREAGGQARRCLVLRPAPGAPLVRELPGVRLGRSIAGHATALTGPGDGPLRLAFQVDGVELGALELRREEGRRAFQVDTAGLAPGRHAVTIVVGGSGAEPGALCLEAQSLP